MVGFVFVVFFWFWLLWFLLFVFLSVYCGSVAFGMVIGGFGLVVRAGRFDGCLFCGYRLLVDFGV